MKLNEALGRLDHHYQMIALWEDVNRHMQQSIDVPQKNIPVSPSVRSTLVGHDVVREAQEKVRVQIEYHKKLAEQYGDSALNPKTIPQEGLPSKKEEKKEKKVEKKEDKKPAATKETAVKESAEAPAAAENQEAASGG